MKTKNLPMGYVVCWFTKKKTRCFVVYTTVLKKQQYKKNIQTYWFWTEEQRDKLISDCIRLYNAEYLHLR